jgi:hypothetical protein
MSASEYKCPLCGCEFGRSSEKCRACPMAGGCNIICCPNCGYGFAEESRLVGWIKRILRMGGRSRGPSDKPTDKGETQ